MEVEYERGAELGELPYHGKPGHAAALRAILQTAQRLSARACAVIDASLHAVEPEWIERLIAPVLTDGFDYVSPYYVRHVNEGAITKGIVYPMFRALYGVRLRQPAASEFGCSGRLVAHYLEQDFWDVEQATVGIDLWLAVAAVCRGVPDMRGGARHSRVGAARRTGRSEHDARRRSWARSSRTSSIAPTSGSVSGGRSRSRPSAPFRRLPRRRRSLNIDGLMDSFRLGYRELREIWTWVLPPRTIVELRKLTEAAPDRFRFDDRLWASIVYDFALGYSLRVMPRDHLLRSLTPLYTGWLASFVLQMRSASLAQIEERVEQLCTGFESEKRYLISRWRWPERMR